MHGEYPSSFSWTPIHSPSSVPVVVGGGIAHQTLAHPVPTASADSWNRSNTDIESIRPAARPCRDVDGEIVILMRSDDLNHVLRIAAIANPPPLVNHLEQPKAFELHLGVQDDHEGPQGSATGPHEGEQKGCLDLGFHEDTAEGL